MSAIEEEMRKAAQAALAAGARRKQLAQSVASTASSSGSSGKRSHKSMVPTASTQVTPEPKVSCTGVPPALEPRALPFGNPGDEGEAEAKIDMTQRIYLNPEVWTDAQPRESQDHCHEPSATSETHDTAVDEPEETLSLEYEPGSPFQDTLPPTSGTLETAGPAPHVETTTPGPMESVPAPVVVDPVPLAPAPAEEAPGPMESVPTAVVVDPVSLAPAPAAVVASPLPVASPVREASRASHVSQKKTGKPDESITFTPVTSAGMSAFFAAIRRPSTQMSFTTEPDVESTLATDTPTGTTEAAMSVASSDVVMAPTPEAASSAAAAPPKATAPQPVAPAVMAPTPEAASSAAAAPPKATAPEPVAPADVVMAPTPEAASSAAAAPPKATAPEPVAPACVVMAPTPEAASSAAAAPPKATAPQPVTPPDVVMAPTPEAASSAAAAPPKATAPQPVAPPDVVMAPTPEAASSAAAAPPKATASAGAPTPEAASSAAAAPPKATAPQPVAPALTAASTTAATAMPPSAPATLAVFPPPCSTFSHASTGTDPAQAPEAEDPRQAKAQYMRYYRSVRSPFCPPAIKAKFDEANECPPAECQRKLQELFQEFKRCNGDWLTSSICLEESRSHTTASCGIWRWVTVDDLKGRYSDELVTKLCREKEQNGDTKPHPEFPGLDAMKLYYVWWEDSTSTTDRYEQRQNLVHDAGYDGGDGDDDGNGGSIPTGNHQKGKGGGKGSGKNGGKGRGKGGQPPPTPTPKVPKEKKQKTPNQLARAAVATANNNILEIAQLNNKLTKAGVSTIIRNALIEQLETCEKQLRDGKSAVETALAMDRELVTPTQGLDEANKKFKDELRHANLHLPKAGKPKAKAKAAPGTA